MSGTMNCPVCGSPKSSVTDSRAAYGMVRRRRECMNGHRYRTNEMPVGEDAGKLLLVSLAELPEHLRRPFSILFHAARDSDGSPKGPDRNGLDGEAATAGAEGIADAPTPDPHPQGEVNQSRRDK